MVKKKSCLICISIICKHKIIKSPIGGWKCKNILKKVFTAVEDEYDMFPSYRAVRKIHFDIKLLSLSKGAESELHLAMVVRQQKALLVPVD